MNILQFNLNDEYIELVKLIKIYSGGLSGGQVKVLIEQGEIIKNGVPEYRKRAKLTRGDLITFLNNTIEII